MELKIENAPKLERGLIDVRLTETPIEIEHEGLLKPSERHGGEAIFIGRVRSQNHGRKVTALSYDSFAPLCETVFREMAHEAQDRWGRDSHVLVLHRVGDLKIGDVAVLIAVSCKHRDEAFQASRYIIENLKERAPIWKKEHYEDGASEWLQGHALCQHRKESEANHHTHAHVGV